MSWDSSLGHTSRTSEGLVKLQHCQYMHLACGLLHGGGHDALLIYTISCLNLERGSNPLNPPLDPALMIRWQELKQICIYSRPVARGGSGGYIEPPIHMNLYGTYVSHTHLIESVAARYTRARERERSTRSSMRYIATLFFLNNARALPSYAHSSHLLLCVFPFHLGKCCALMYEVAKVFRSRHAC
jgi:hypothetical protein